MPSFGKRLKKLFTGNKKKKRAAPAPESRSDTHGSNELALLEIEEHRKRHRRRKRRHRERATPARPAHGMGPIGDNARSELSETLHLDDDDWLLNAREEASDALDLEDLLGGLSADRDPGSASSSGPVTYQISLGYQTIDDFDSSSEEERSATVTYEIRPGYQTVDDASFEDKRPSGTVTYQIRPGYQTIDDASVDSSSEEELLFSESDDASSFEDKKPSGTVTFQTRPGYQTRDDVSFDSSREEELSGYQIREDELFSESDDSSFFDDHEVLFSDSESDSSSEESHDLIPMEEVVHEMAKWLGDSWRMWEDFKDAFKREFQGNTAVPSAHSVLQAGSQAGLFWREPFFQPRIFSRTFGIREICAKVCETAMVGGGDSSYVEDLTDDYLMYTPLDLEEALHYAQEGGYVRLHSEGVEVLANGVGLVARSASLASTELDKSRQAANRDQEGYATLGMHTAHSGMDTEHPVVYHRSQEEREPTVLRMEAGVFVWAAGDKAQQPVEGPDLSGLTDTEVWDTSPNFFTQRSFELQHKHGLAKMEARLAAVQEARELPRLLFVMNASGTFFATEGKLHKIHHSTLLAGEDVACAGEIGLSGGKVIFLSNSSGHYLPGPAHVWQALHSLARQGADLSMIDVEIHGVGQLVKADWLLHSFLPGHTLPMEPQEGVEAVKKRLSDGGSGAASGTFGLSEGIVDPVFGHLLPEPKGSGPGLHLAGLPWFADDMELYQDDDSSESELTEHASTTSSTASAPLGYSSMPDFF